MKAHHLLTTVVLIGGAAVAYTGLTYLAIQHRERDAAAPAAASVATTTEATTTEATTTPPTQEQKPATEPERIYVPVQTQQPTPTIEITNGVKNEGNGTVNYYQAPQQQTQQREPAAGSAPQFTEPREMTPLEIATEIVHLYDPNGSAEMYGSDKIRVYVYGGKSVTADITSGWEERQARPVPECTERTTSRSARSSSGTRSYGIIEP